MKIEINEGFTENQKSEVVEIFMSAFRFKFSKLYEGCINESTIYSLMINETESLTAVNENGEIVGVLSYKTTKSQKDSMSIKTLFELIGIKKGLLSIIVFTLLEAKVKKDELYIDYVAVSEAARGLGIGSKLITAVEEIALKENLKFSSLAVIETNTDAIKLYKKLGYVKNKEESLSPLNKILNWDFSKSHYMVKNLF